MKALLICNPQVDIVDNCYNGKEVISNINKIKANFVTIIVSQLSFTNDHCSFSDSYKGKKEGESLVKEGHLQLLGPKHCVKGTPGAAFHPDFDQSGTKCIVNAGSAVLLDSRSAFFERFRQKSTGLSDFLYANNITSLYICGFPWRDHVKMTARDSIGMKLTTFLIQEGIGSHELIDFFDLDQLNSIGVKVVSWNL